jgi:hypothetical protein
MHLNFGGRPVNEFAVPVSSNQTVTVGPKGAPVLTAGPGVRVSIPTAGPVPCVGCGAAPAEDSKPWWLLAVAAAGYWYWKKRK